MRIAIVCPYAWDKPGGVQTHVRGLAAALRRNEHQVGVFAPGPLGSSPEPGVTLVGRAVPVPANGSVAPITFGPVAAAGIRRALTGFDPDVVHLHEPLIPSLSLLALWSTRAATVGTFHASADSSMGYRAGKVILDRAIRRLSVRTAVSDAARALIVRYFPGDVTLTPNGIETEPFVSATPLDLGVDGPKVLFFGRLERRKGLEVLIQAMTRLRGRATLLVAGTGPEERTCTELAEGLQVDAFFLGRVDERDKAGLYRAADVYCAPGLGGESFGIVLLEAMAAGTPVVCSDLPGFRAVAGAAGRLVPPGDAGALADAIRDVLDDGDEAARMRKMGLGTARAFDWSRLVAGVTSVYERAIEDNAARAR